MSFAAMPLWLVLSLGGAALLATLVLYLLRRTPRPQMVSNIEFWLRAQQSAKPKFLASFRVPLLALLLSLLAVALLVTLSGDPRFGSGVRGTTVIVVSAGTSMSAEGPDGSRMERALLEVRRWVERTTIAGEVAVVRAGVTPSVILPLTDDAASLERALDGLEPDDGEADLAAALALADSILEAHGALAQGSGQILIVADEQPTLTTRAPAVAVPVGTPVDTVAITALAARRVPTAMGEYAVRVEVHAFASTRASARVVVYDGEVAVLDERVEIPARGSEVLEGGGFSRAQAELRAELRDIRIEGSSDGYARDDRAYAAVPAYERTRVLLVTAGNVYLEAALAAHPGLAVEVMAPGGLPSLGGDTLSTYHALVLDGAALASHQAHPAQILFAPPPRGPVGVERAITRPRVTGTLASHPALGGVRLDSASFTRATPLSPVAEDRVLARAGERVLAIARRSRDARLVAYGFAPEDSDLVRGEAFPVLMDASIRWAAARDEALPLSHRLGESLLAEAGRTVRGPDGEELEVLGGVIPRVARAGIFHVGERAIAFGGTETAGPLGAGATGGTFAAQSTLPPLAVLVAAALLLLMLFEWTLLHRGKLE